MAKQIFINLAVKDVQKSMDFYTALGFTNNPQFSDDSGKCMVQFVANRFSGGKDYGDPRGMMRDSLKRLMANFEGKPVVEVIMPATEVLPDPKRKPRPNTPWRMQATQRLTYADEPESRKILFQYEIITKDSGKDRFVFAIITSAVIGTTVNGEFSCLTSDVEETNLIRESFRLLVK